MANRLPPGGLFFDGFSRLDVSAPAFANKYLLSKTARAG
jgi:hypothetical protein